MQPLNTKKDWNRNTQLVPFNWKEQSNSLITWEVKKADGVNSLKFLSLFTQL